MNSTTVGHQSSFTRKILLVPFLVCVVNIASAQVIISLLLGDKLNSGTVEFGLDGGLNLSTLTGDAGANSSTGFFLGFYFDIKTKSKYLIRTGVIVKSPMGADGFTPYSLNDSNLDNAFAGGEVSRTVKYFNVPFAIKRVFNNNMFADAGIQLGLLHKAYDDFENKVNDPDDLTFRLDIKDKYHPLDAGLVVGGGYRLMKGNGMNLGIHYYHGLVDITVDDAGPNVYNRCLYFSVGIPIGAAKAKTAANQN